MRLTPDLLAAAYSLLRETDPFRGWNLPDAEDVRFAVTKSRDFGDYSRPHLIRLSARRHTRLSGILATVAHEMLHLHLEEVGAKADSAAHGPGFCKLARLVCRHHPEFDTASF